MICRQIVAVLPQYALRRLEMIPGKTHNAWRLTRLVRQRGRLVRLEVTSMPIEPMPVVNQTVEAERYILVRNFDCERRR